MALEQALLLSKNGVIIPVSKSPLTNIRFSSFSYPNPQSLPFRIFSLSWKRKKLSFGGNIRSSLDYGNSSVNFGQYDSSVGVQLPRPTEIQWKKELCNSVQLIGLVGTPVQIKYLGSGKAVAWSRLAVKKSSTETSWINLTFWDELAHVASQHIEKGHQIYVSGRLVSDTVEGDDGKQQTYYKVVVQTLNFIEKGFSSVALYEGDSNSTSSGRKFGGSYAANNTGSTEELWQAFFANPVDWWDNRRNKRKPNYPDFKHKDTGEALWVEGRNNPSWVKSQLAVLDSKMESFNDQQASLNVNFLAGENYTPF